MTGSVRPLHPGRADDLGQAAAIDLESVQPWLPTVSALAELLPGSGLRRGASIPSKDRPRLPLPPSSVRPRRDRGAGWSVFPPSAPAETAAGLGVDLDRLALVPFLGTSWLEVVAALIEAVDIVVVRPPPRVFDADARRLAARVRQRGAVLVVLGQWPGCELRLTVTGSQWTGLGAGHGHCSPGRSRCPRSVVARPVDHVSLGCGFPIPMGTFVRSKRPPQLVPSPRATSIALMLSPVGRDERDERDDEMTMPIRTLVIWFPDWPVIAAAHEVGCPPEAPIAVLDKGRVVACSSTARTEGVRRGLRTREAQARCPDLIVLKHGSRSRRRPDAYLRVEGRVPEFAAARQNCPAVNGEVGGYGDSGFTVHWGPFR